MAVSGLALDRDDFDHLGQVGLGWALTGQDSPGRDFLDRGFPGPGFPVLDLLDQVGLAGVALTSLTTTLFVSHFDLILP